MLTGCWLTQSLYVAAKLGLADLLTGGPRSVEDLAAASGAHAPSVHRLLRALASIEVFVEGPERTFGLTPLAECLRSDRPGSQRSMALMLGEERYLTWGQLLYSVRTGDSAFEKLYGAPVFEYLSRNPAQAEIFDAAMVGIHGRESAAMLEAYDFSGVGVLADLGGGNGSLLTAVLSAHPAMRGVLFDLPGVAGRAASALAAAGLGDRCRAEGGSFFEEVPAGADAYLMRRVIHDWDDDEALAILRVTRKAMRPDARLLLIEGIIPAGNGPSSAKFLDLNMLVNPGGKERTEAEYRELLRAAGLELTRVVPTRAEASVIEARPIG